MSKLPLASNIGALTADTYMRPLNPAADRPYSTGFSHSVSISLDVSSEPIYGVVDGVSTKIDSWITEKGGSVSITFQEGRADLVAAALMATSAALTQTSVTAATLTATNVKSGELIDLGKLDVTAVSLTDGEGPIPTSDYTVNAKSGTILIRADHPTIEVTYSAPAITADAGRAVSAILNSPNGLVVELTVVGKNPRGVRYKITGLRVALKPSGEFTVAGDGKSLSEITLEGDIIINEDDPDAPFGYIEQLS